VAERTGDRPINTRRATSGRVVGIDVGGSGIKGAPVDLSVGRFAAERVRLATPQPASPDRVAKVVAEVLDRLDVTGPVGVTLPAVVVDGVVATAANIDPSWIGVRPVELFERATGRAVGVLNDADAAGIAEMRYGVGKGRGGVVVVVTLGTGIGSALFTDGVLVPNTELGHLPLHHGDAEDWAADAVRDREGLSWKHYARRLQKYLELVQRLLWPRLIIIGGGVSRKAEKFLPHIELRTEVVPARLHNDAGIVGAALFAPLSLGRAAVPAH
jgi:polyphosphate glucokinase